MSEMIERVARAIRRHFNEGMRDFDDNAPIVGDGEDVIGDYMILARAAVEAMREPTKAMINAGGDVLCDAADTDFNSFCTCGGGSAYVRSGAQTDTWHAMLDEALEDDPSLA